MKKLLFSFVLLFSTIMCYSAEGGVMTSNPNPIISDQTATLFYDGADTNFAAWTPRCHIHTWLLPADGETLSQDYGTAWAACSSNEEYDALDDKLKMTFGGTPGQYNIDINIKDFFNVADEDLNKIGTIGVIVRTQFSGGGDQTQDFLLAVAPNDITGVESNTVADIACSVKNQTITVSSDTRIDAKLYSLSGVLVNQVVADKEVSFSNLQAGVYFVQVNGQVKKVNVQ